MSPTLRRVKVEVASELAAGSAIRCRPLGPSPAKQAASQPHSPPLASPTRRHPPKAADAAVIPRSPLRDKVASHAEEACASGAPLGGPKPAAQAAATLPDRKRLADGSPKVQSAKGGEQQQQQPQTSIRSQKLPSTPAAVPFVSVSIPAALPVQPAPTHARIGGGGSISNAKATTQTGSPTSTASPPQPPQSTLKALGGKRVRLSTDKRSLVMQLGTPIPRERDYEQIMRAKMEDLEMRRRKAAVEELERAKAAEARAALQRDRELERMRKQQRGERSQARQTPPAAAPTPPSVVVDLTGAAPPAFAPDPADEHRQPGEGRKCLGLLRHELAQWRACKGEDDDDHTSRPERTRTTPTRSGTGRRAAAEQLHSRTPAKAAKAEPAVEVNVVVPPPLPPPQSVPRAQRARPLPFIEIPTERFPASSVSARTPTTACGNVNALSTPASAPKFIGCGGLLSDWRREIGGIYALASPLAERSLKPRPSVGGDGDAQLWALERLALGNISGADSGNDDVDDDDMSAGTDDDFGRGLIAEDVLLSGMAAFAPHGEMEVLSIEYDTEDYLSSDSDNALSDEDEEDEDEQDDGRDAGGKLSASLMHGALNMSPQRADVAHLQSLIDQAIQLARSTAEALKCDRPASPTVAASVRKSVDELDHRERLLDHLLSV